MNFIISETFEYLKDIISLWKEFIEEYEWTWIIMWNNERLEMNKDTSKRTKS